MVTSWTRFRAKQHHDSFVNSVVATPFVVNQQRKLAVRPASAHPPVPTTLFRDPRAGPGPYLMRDTSSTSGVKWGRRMGPPSLRRRSPPDQRVVPSIALLFRLPGWP